MFKKKKKNKYISKLHPDSENEIAMQALVLIVGGFETTSRTLSYVSFKLAHNPDIQVLT